MTTTTTAIAGTELVPVSEPLFSDGERAALAGFLAGYSGLTRDAYTLDLRQYMSWCTRRGLRLFAARRADIECFGRDMEAAGRARATIARRLCTIAGFYRYAVEEELLGNVNPTWPHCDGAGWPHLSCSRGGCGCRGAIRRSTRTWWRRARALEWRHQPLRSRAFEFR